MKTRLAIFLIALLLAGCAASKGPTLPAPITIELEQAQGTASVPPAK